jgi:hypothetical protein
MLNAFSIHEHGLRPPALRVASRDATHERDQKKAPANGARLL